jgi:hypothetical protein
MALLCKAETALGPLFGALGACRMTVVAMTRREFSLLEVVVASRETCTNRRSRTGFGLTADAASPRCISRGIGDVDILCANSASAKGRIERCFGTLQDRLVKELRLAEISDREAANAFLLSFIARGRKSARSQTL